MTSWRFFEETEVKKITYSLNKIYCFQNYLVQNALELGVKHLFAILHFYTP